MRALCPLVICGWVALGQQATGQSQETKSKQAAADSAKAIDDFKTDAAEYVIRLASRPKDKLALYDEPLLHWGNPARTGEDGAVFVWMLDGPPEVLGHAFTYRLPTLI